MIAEAYLCSHHDHHLSSWQILVKFQGQSNPLSSHLSLTLDAGSVWSEGVKM